MELPKGFSPVFALIVLVGILIGVGSFTFFYADGASYFTGSPESCNNCHVMNDYYDSWLKSSHTAVAGCSDCHLPDQFPINYLSKADNGFRHAWAFTFQTYEGRLQMIPRNKRILQTSCIDCHGDFVGHTLDEESGPKCVQCHVDVGHGPPR